MDDRAERTRHVGLEDDPQFLGLARLDLRVEVLERGLAAALGPRGRGRLALLDHGPGGLLVGHDTQDVARLGHVAEAQDHCRRRRSRLGDALAQGILEGTNLAVGLAHDDHVADSKGAGLDQGGGNRATPLVQFSFDDRADGGTLGVGLELLQVRHEADHLEEFVQAQPGLGRNGDHRNVATVLLDHDTGLGQAVLDAVGVGVGLVDLVERDDDRYLCGARVVDRLQCLRHDAIVRRDHDHGDVRDLGTAGTHGGERLVARGVEEDDAAVVRDDFARADVLGDAAALAGRDLRGADCVEERRLAVVDVAHHGHDRGARLEERLVVLLEQLLLGRGADRGRLGALSVRARDYRHGHRLGDLEAELLGDERRGLAVDPLVDVGEDAALDQLADHVGGIDAERVGQVLHGDAGGQLYRATVARIQDLRRTDRTALAANRLAGSATAPRAASTLGQS